MANPQLEDGFMRVANGIVDNICKLSLNGTEQKVIWCVIRYTYGFNRRSHCLSASFISQWANCDISSVKTGAIAYLQGKLGECAAVLVNTATDTEVPAQIRVNAANAALSQCSQWTKNVDMIERLEAMEELMSRVEQEQKSQRRRT